MSGTYAGSSASYPSTVATIENGDEPNEITFQTPLTNLTDRTEYLRAHSYDIVTTTYSSQGNFTYTVPANCKRLEFTVVGGGRGGNNGGPGTGGSGGQGSEVVQSALTGSMIPASIAGYVGAGGAPNSSGQSSFLTIGGSTWLLAVGGGLSAPSISDVAITSNTGAAGGAAGAGSAGSLGKHSRHGAGGAGGLTDAVGLAGRGYGAGGGGAKQASGAASGGGGGGGGFGYNARASDGSGATGGAGADGVVIITAYIQGLTP